MASGKGAPRGFKGRKNKGNLGSSLPREDVERLQRQALDIVRANMKNAKRVLDGGVRWDSNQVKLFLALMDRVVPAAEYSSGEDEDSINDMSADELRALIAGEVSKRQLPSPDVSFDDYVDVEVLSPIMADDAE